MGRPRRLDVRRHPSGRINYSGRDRDGGPPEVIARRLVLVRGEDPALAESPLGIARARGLISEAEMRAGTHYAWLYSRYVGRAIHPKAAPLERGDRGLGVIDFDGPAERRIAQAFLAAKAALRDCGRRSMRAVEDLCVFRRWPDFLGGQADGHAPAHARAGEALAEVRAGLKTLAAAFGYQVVDRRGRPG